MFRQKKKIVLFVISIILLFSFICIPVSALVTNPYVGGSSLKYGPVEFGMPFCDNISQVVGVANEISPYFYDNSTPAQDIPEPYLGYTASTILYPKTGNYFTANQKFRVLSTLSFDKKVSRVELLIKYSYGFNFGEHYWGAGNYANFITMGNDNLDVVCSPQGDNILWVSLFNVEDPIQIVSHVNATVNLSEMIYLVSVYKILYADGTLAQIQNDNVNTNKIVNNQNSNADKINSNADKNASNIQSNNDKNTQSIIDNQNQLVEQEKTETQNSGNDSVNDVSSSVPDKSAGMLSALQSLSNAVSYTGTSAKWTFPQMYIPSIAGVTDRINLNSEMEIDFTYWVNQIPQNIRTVITALATIGLVIFAFKELYGLISYVLTLKGGGNNE